MVMGALSRERLRAAFGGPGGLIPGVPAGAVTGFYANRAAAPQFAGKTSIAPGVHATMPG